MTAGANLCSKQSEPAPPPESVCLRYGMGYGMGVSRKGMPCCMLHANLRSSLTRSHGLRASAIATSGKKSPNAQMIGTSFQTLRCAASTPSCTDEHISGHATYHRMTRRRRSHR